MTSSPISNEEVGIRMCILSEFLHSDGKLSINDAYNNLCKEIGHDIITYEDFKFWMERYENRQFDLGYDRNKAPKPKEFSDFPTNVLDNIVAHLDPTDRYSVGNVCRGFRAAIPKQSDFLELFLVMNSDWIVVCTDKERIQYNKKDDFSETKWVSNNGNFVKSVDGKDFCEKAFAHFAYRLRNKKLHVKKLVISQDDTRESPEKTASSSEISRGNDKQWKCVDSLLKSLNRQILVRKLRIVKIPGNVLLTAIKSLSTMALNGINFTWNDYENAAKIDEIMKTDQWKKAEKLKLGGLKLQDLNQIVNGISHFEEFTLCCEKINSDNFNRFIEVLIKSPSFNRGALHCGGLKEEQKNELMNCLDSQFVRHENNKQYYLIPESNTYFWIEYSHFIVLEKRRELVRIPPFRIFF